MSAESPRVAVAIPTYNRAADLERAIESVLGQTHRNLELVVLDNASTDETETVARTAAARDRRVRYVRQPRNLGLTANVNAAFRAGAAPYALVLADDDRLAPDYVERCLRALEDDPGCAVVSGSARYGAAEGVRMDLLDDDPARRVLAYLAQVADNVSIYGVFRRAPLERALPMRNLLAGDWLLLCAVLYQGKLRTLGETWIARSPAGTSANWERTVSSLGLGRLQGRLPHLAIAWFVLADVGWRTSVYRPLGRARRLALALAAAATVVRAHGREIVWDAVHPLLLHPRVEPLYRRIRPPR